MSAADRPDTADALYSFAAVCVFGIVLQFGILVVGLQFHDDPAKLWTVFLICAGVAIAFAIGLVTLGLVIEVGYRRWVEA